MIHKRPGMIYSLRNKVALTFFVLFIVPFTIVIMLLSNEANKLIGQSIETTALQSMDQYATYTHTVMGQTENVGQQAINSERLQQWTAAQLRNDLNEYERFKITQNLLKSFYSLLQFNPTVDSIQVYDNDGHTISLEDDAPDDSYLTSDWYKAAKESITWLNAHKVHLHSGDGQGKEVNSMTLPIVNLVSLEKVGVLKVDVRTQLLKEPLEKIQLGRSGLVFLIDGEGNSILGQDTASVSGLSRPDLQAIAQDAQEAGQLQMKKSKDDSMIFYRKLEGVNWILIGWVPRKDLYAKVTQTKHSLLLLSAMLLLLILPCAYWLSAGIARPLSKLARAMRYAEQGEWKTAEEVTPMRLAGNHEVGYVISVFHTMLINLQRSIDKQYELIVQRKDTEYKALLLQINPHFLYNTLGVISALSAQKKNDEVMDVTESLGQMLRYSLKLDSNLVSLSEELLYIRRYIGILDAYHGDAIDVSVREEPGLERIQIVKFILQPLVENAVKYSLNTDRTAEVAIDARMCGEHVQLAVTDNGIGMKPQLVAALMAEEQPSHGMLKNGGREIGLRNVLARCRLFYGAAFRFTVTSEENRGTTITFFIPDIKR
ncbi:cache domain-containing sensor histidine kinase [Cohnella sp. 56]|uniref:cache domain-containing sensor histidine kinase n=1 Tax=Cohnella sp. 56 TaxID=3113722 RepID=UPI0030E8BDB7